MKARLNDTMVLASLPDVDLEAPRASAGWNSSGRLDVRQEIDNAPLRPFHIRLGLLISLILLADGYDLYNAAYIVHSVAGLWRLSPGEIGVLLSSGLAGFAAGSTVSGLLGDRLGRRKVLLLGCWASGIMSLAIAVAAHDFFSYVALRVVMGLALGLLMPIAVTYINEIAPARVSNVFTAWFFSLGWLAGASSAGIVAAWLTPRFGWQSLYYAGAALLSLTVLVHWLPESPHYLASRARWSELRVLLGKIRPDRAQRYESAQLYVPTRIEHRGSARVLFSRDYWVRTVSCCCAGALSLFSAYGLSGWLPTIMLKRGENLSASFAYGSLLAAMAVFGGLLAGFAADRSGDRRRVVAISFVLGAAAIWVLARSHNHNTTIIAVAAAGAFVVGSQIVLNNLVAAMYPTEIRGTGVGIFLGLSRVGAMLGPLLAGLIQQWSGTYDAMFIAIGGALLLTAALVYGAMPSSESVTPALDT
ncbi:AAHS family 4-hydroxybenzoate transporter-like MFS transporter [Paraburkholderia sp. RAU6.4a]|uniref:MFS transporter n=1 Tax=Paraburkholderia sp. RAU6.4a TaxID=2991067 RepID=UPI003D1ACCE7